MATPQRRMLATVKADHEAVRALFQQFDALGRDGEQDTARAELVDEICRALTIHMRLEEDLFYPALRAAQGNEELIDEAEAEHAGARDLVLQLE